MKGIPHPSSYFSSETADNEYQSSYWKPIAQDLSLCSELHVQGVDQILSITPSLLLATP